ncbi:hypothetical protein GUJ93_ZPchr0004g38443 [Zizania palustris]|uniref:C2H2-type domain-containing protein n=1 Tax=Zizania palustris TaxID=103762 RepID=A0A8J5RWG7_ZIZPA|nr:hypothetical protein GUJ93_ZPchr0004g38443 [Zizania palustris]
MESRSATEQGHQQQRRPAAWCCSFSLAAGFSWPPQRSSSSSSYTCGYCRREFRSAQALGGHMNVHRRERARLRQCPNNPSTACLTRAPLPNLNLSPPPPPPPQYYFPGADRPAIVYSFFSTTATTAPLEADHVELGDVVDGVCSNNGAGGMEEDVLDLELRLGCS